MKIRSKQKELTLQEIEIHVEHEENLKKICMKTLVSFLMMPQDMYQRVKPQKLHLFPIKLEHKNWVCYNRKLL